MTDALEKSLMRSEQRVHTLERIIEDRSRELFLERERLKESSEYLLRIIEAVPKPLFVVDVNARIETINSAALQFLGFAREELVMQPLVTIMSAREIARFTGAHRSNTSETTQTEANLTSKSGDLIPVLITASNMTSTSGEGEKVVCIATDRTKQKAEEAQRLQSQKLESVGQLAAGIAHELNTPIQYIRDNMGFLASEFVNLSALLKGYESLCEVARNVSELKSSAEDLLSKREAIDLPYLIREIPIAIQQTLEGADSVAKIVRALKEFSHPGSSERSDLEINKALLSIITIARNEWKYVANLETDFDSEIPPVPCFVGELNQALLNILINASHAVDDANKSRGAEQGLIRIKTEQNQGNVIIRISDSGLGIPESIQSRIFEPFFTTKEVGRGSGQGLAMAYSTIVKKHGGQITFETEQGRGTTFIISLPKVPNFKA